MEPLMPWMAKTSLMCVCTHVHCIYRTYIYNTTHKHAHRHKLRFFSFLLKPLPCLSLLLVTTLCWNSLVVLSERERLTLLLESLCALQPLTRTICCLLSPCPLYFPVLLLLPARLNCKKRAVMLEGCVRSHLGLYAASSVNVCECCRG